MYSFILAVGVAFVSVQHLNILSSVDACSLPPPRNVCQNVSCPYENTCVPKSVTWCQDRVLDTCFPPLPICGDSMDPCTVTLCPNGTVCFSVKDQCSDNGACTIKAQCEALNKPGTCPPPRLVFSGECVTSCQNDAKCPSGMKCCPAQTDVGTANFCLQLSAGR